MFEAVDEVDESARARLGRTINGRWKLVKLLGTGGMAAVYAAEGPNGERAALKLLHPDMERKQSIRDRFLREGTTAQRIDHPGVVRILETTDAKNSTAALVMELLEGQPLDEVADSQGRLPTQTLLSYLDQVLDVLAIAHAEGIIHRDLKPANLFVVADGKIKVLDFGVARVLEGIPEDKRTKTGITLGTVPFMSPEQALGKRDEIDGRTDLFALGAMAFWLITGQEIHQADSTAGLLVAMATQPAPKLASVAPDTPADVCAIVDVALAFNKNARYPDAATMQADVRAVMQGHAPAFASKARSANEQATNVDIPVPRVAAASAQPAATVVGPKQDAVTAEQPGLGSTAQPARASSTLESPSALVPAAAQEDVHSKATVVGPAPDQKTVVEAAGAAGARVGPTGTVVEATPPPAIAQSAQAGKTDTSESRRKPSGVMILAVAAAALVVGAGAVFALSGDGDSQSKAATRSNSLGELGDSKQSQETSSNIEGDPQAATAQSATGSTGASKTPRAKQTTEASPTNVRASATEEAAKEPASATESNAPTETGANQQTGESARQKVAQGEAPQGTESAQTGSEATASEPAPKKTESKKEAAERRREEKKRKREEKKRGKRH